MMETLGTRRTFAGHGAWSENGLFQRNFTMAQKRPKLTPCPCHRKTGAQQPTLYLSSTNSLTALCNLVPSDSRASMSHRLAMWGHDTEIGKTGCLWLPTSFAVCGNTARPSLNAPLLLLSSTLCAWVWFGVSLAAY